MAGRRGTKFESGLLFTPESPRALGAKCAPRFVTTRYQGSKARLIPFLEEIFSAVQFDSAIDLFSGTASVAYLLKRLGKAVTANDFLACNGHVARALVENNSVRATSGGLGELFVQRAGTAYDDFVHRRFAGVFFTDAENRELDVVAQNLESMPPGHAQSLLYYAVFQACLKKRPFNLFHRKNLNLRTRNVTRSFGNKTTWDKALFELTATALAEANRAVFQGSQPCVVLTQDALEVKARAALVYLDPPYVGPNGGTDYLAYYHFLEGLCGYSKWDARIDADSKHCAFLAERSPFSDPRHNEEALFALFEQHRHAILVVSYRGDGSPEPVVLSNMLRAVGKRVRVHRAPKQYALSKSPGEELVFVGT